MLITVSFNTFYLNNPFLKELLSMSIVRFDKSYKVCATCTFWKGKRQIENGCVVFNNRDTGICGGTAFKDWSMGATSTCLEWQYLDGSGNGASVDTPSVKKMAHGSPP